LFIKELSLKNFRNYDLSKINFNKNINIILGSNGQGKTSLIEAIYALSTTKSHRTSKDLKMVKFNENFALVSAMINRKSNDDDFELSLSISNKGKNAKHNGVPIQKLSDYIGTLKTVFFAPEDLELIKGAPNTRRKFLNMEIGQIDGLYIHNLNLYSKVLKQRNELLKNFIENETNQLMLEVLTEQLVEPLVYILEKRNWFIRELETYARTVHFFLTEEEEEISFKYISGFNLEEISFENILGKYISSYPVDKKYRTTSLGAHRDDFALSLSGMNAHDFASQGQQRTSILSIKLAEVDLIRNFSRDYPVLLLDDVLSELDSNRQGKLLEYTKNKTQTFITTTSINGISDEIIKNSDVRIIKEARIGEYHE